MEELLQAKKEECDLTMMLELCYSDSKLANELGCVPIPYIVPLWEYDCIQFAEKIRLGRLLRLKKALVSKLEWRNFNSRMMSTIRSIFSYQTEAPPGNCFLGLFIISVI
jgi:hypothetical protein